jgi:hypothetical protein
MFPAVRRERVEASPAITGRQTPLPFDPAIEFQPLESRVERSFFHPQQIVGQLLNQLSNGITMQMAAGQYFEDHHVQRARQKIGLRFLCSHRRTDHQTEEFRAG